MVSIGGEVDVTNCCKERGIGDLVKRAVYVWGPEYRVPEEKGCLVQQKKHT